VILNLFFFQI